MTLEEKRLVRRYLVWCYKTTKEDLDRIDRKFTQLKVDDYLWNHLMKSQKKIPSALKEQYARHVEDFRNYKDKKQKEAFEQKFLDGDKQIPKVDYLYLKNRLRTIERAIKSFLGIKELKSIQVLYEGEMTRRILEAREH